MIETALTLCMFFYFYLAAVSLHCFVVRQDVALSLRIKHIDIMVSKVDDPYPAAGRINDYRAG
ncbi:hypothetical protein TUM17562_33620 [Klebsiella pneumoniae]|nr:hypothetical protein TUM17562_33620 [Klebsiella pneumoniae]GJK74987.1 hypothetical protein TUM17565_22000 [Klebsiella pneumoniae]